MKQPKKYLSIILVIVMLLFGGCGTFLPQEGTPDDTTIPDPTPNNPDPVITCQYLPQKVDNPENLPVLKWVCLTERQYGGGVRTWNETAAVELNQMLSDRNMPFRVQFALLTMDQWLLEYSDWFSRPEAQKELADADLIYGRMRASDMQKYLQPITEYIHSSAEISLENAVPHAYNWLAATVSNAVYGIPTGLNLPCAGAWQMKPDFLEKYGLTEEAFSGNFWEMDNLFEEIYKKNNETPFLFISHDTITAVSNSYTGITESWAPGAFNDIMAPFYNEIGACFAIDYTSDTPVVANILKTDIAYQIRNAFARYKTAGYIIDEELLANNDPKIDIEALKELSYCTACSDSTHTNSYGNLIVPNTRMLFQSTLPGGPISGIAAISQYKAEALSLLNLIAEDEEFRMQLFYGKEGRDYTISDGYYEITRYEDRSSYSLDFLSPLSYFAGLTSNIETANFLSPGTENWYLYPYDGKTQFETYQAFLENSTLYYPITFNYSGFENELSAMKAVCTKYFLKFSRLTDDQYDQMLQELEDAGSDKILKALQQQLDQWLAENPNWK